MPLRFQGPDAVFATVVATSLIALGLVSPAPAGNLDVRTASYLGGSGDDAGWSAGMGPGNTVIFGGKLPGHDPAGVTPTPLLGGGDGAVVRLDRTGRSVLSVSRLGAFIGDMQVGPDDRIVVAAGGLGPAVLTPDAGAVAWQKSLPDVSRVSVGADGTVAALVEHGGSNYDLHTYDAAGAPIGSRHFSDRMVNDVAVDSARGQVIVTGFNGKSYQGWPVQVPFIRAYGTDLGGEPNWVDYDWTATQVHDDQGSSMADSRGYRVTIAGDDNLYFMGEAHGGNSTYRYDAQIVDRKLPGDEWIKIDKYSDPWQTRAEVKTVFGRYDPATGIQKKVQWLFGRQDDNDGAFLRCRGFAADEAGHVYLTGTASYSIKNRDASQIEGQPVGPYSGGELTLAVIAPDFLSREVWTVFTAPDSGEMSSRGYALAAREGLAVLAGSLENPAGELLTAHALQDADQGGDEGFLTVWTPWGPGDTDGDGDVDLDDAGSLIGNWRQTDLAWAEGDFDADGDADLGDAEILLANWSPRGASEGLTTVPEPLTLLVIPLGSLALLPRGGKARDRSPERAT